MNFWKEISSVLFYNNVRIKNLIKVASVKFEISYLIT